MKYLALYNIIYSLVWKNWKRKKYEENQRIYSKEYSRTTISSSPSHILHSRTFISLPQTFSPAGEGVAHRAIFDKSVQVKQLSVVEAHGILLLRVDKGTSQYSHFHTMTCTTTSFLFSQHDQCCILLLPFQHTPSLLLPHTASPTHHEFPSIILLLGSSAVFLVMSDGSACECWKLLCDILMWETLLLELVRCIFIFVVLEFIFSLSFVFVQPFFFHMFMFCVHKFVLLNSPAITNMKVCVCIIRN